MPSQWRNVPKYHFFSLIRYLYITAQFVRLAPTMCQLCLLHLYRDVEGKILCGFVFFLQPKCLPPMSESGSAFPVLTCCACVMVSRVLAAAQRGQINGENALSQLTSAESSGVTGGVSLLWRRKSSASRPVHGWIGCLLFQLYIAQLGVIDR